MPSRKSQAKIIKTLTVLYREVLLEVKQLRVELEGLKALKS
jgi:hypothetical protein